MTESSKRAKVSNETPSTKFDQYRSFIRSHDLNLWKSLDTKEKAKKHLATLNEFRWITFGDKLTDDFIVQSVGYQLRTQFAGLEKLLVAELDGFVEDECGLCLFPRGRFECDFVSLFERTFFECRSLIVRPFLRGMSMSIMCLMLSRITIDEKLLALLSELKLHHAESKKKNLPEFGGRGLDVIVESEICREFFERLTDRLVQFAVFRPMECIFELPTKVIASLLFSTDYRSFGHTCKRIYRIISSASNRAEIADIRFRRQFGNTSNDVLRVRERFYPKDYSITQFKYEAMSVAKNMYAGAFSGDSHRPICLDILHRSNGSFNFFCHTFVEHSTIDEYFEEVLMNTHGTQMMRLFDEENVNYKGTHILDCCITNWQQITQNWDVAERLCDNDRTGEVFMSLMRNLAFLQPSTITAGAFKLIIYCLNNVCMSHDERAKLKTVLHLNLDYAEDCITKIVNEYNDFDFYCQQLGNNSVASTICIKFVRAVIAMWLYNQHSGWSSRTHHYVAKLLAYTGNTDYLKMLYVMNKNEDFWTDVLFLLLESGCPFSIQVQVTAYLINGKNARVENHRMPYFSGHPKTIVDLAKRIILSTEIRNLDKRLIEMIPLIEKYQDSDFWCSYYLRCSGNLSPGASSRFLSMLRHYNQMNDRLEYLLSRGVVSKYAIQVK